MFGNSFQKRHTAVLAALEAVAEGRSTAGELVRAFRESLADSVAFVRLVTRGPISTMARRVCLLICDPGHH